MTLLGFSVTRVTISTTSCPEPKCSVSQCSFHWSFSFPKSFKQIGHLNPIFTSKPNQSFQSTATPPLNLVVRRKREHQPTSEPVESSYPSQPDRPVCCERPAGELFVFVQLLTSVVHSSFPPNQRLEAIAKTPDRFVHLMFSFVFAQPHP